MLEMQHFLGVDSLDGRKSKGLEVTEIRNPWTSLTGSGEGHRRNRVQG
jgi:hypothetical protein